MYGNGSAELGEHDRAGDSDMRGHPQREPGAVIQPGQDLGVGAGSAVGPGEPDVGEVRLPTLIGHRGFS